MQGYQCPVCFEDAVIDQVPYGTRIVPQARWSDAVHSCGILTPHRARHPFSTGSDVWVSSEAMLKVLMQDSTWYSIRAYSPSCRVSYDDLKERAGRIRHPLVITFSKEYNELLRQVPSLEILSNEITEGIRDTNSNGHPLRIEYLIHEDYENPSWKQIAIEVYSSEELDFDRAMDFWKRLEDQIRPRIKKAIQEHSSELRPSPIEITNKNISIGFNW